MQHLIIIKSICRTESILYTRTQHMYKVQCSSRHAQLVAPYEKVLIKLELLVVEFGE